jgi:hypothetical protein
MAALPANQSAVTNQPANRRLLQLSVSGCPNGQALEGALCLYCVCNCMCYDRCRCDWRNLHVCAAIAAAMQIADRQLLMLWLCAEYAQMKAMRSATGIISVEAAGFCGPRAIGTFWEHFHRQTCMSTSSHARKHSAHTLWHYCNSCLRP